jgi:MFS family permease
MGPTQRSSRRRPGGLMIKQDVEEDDVLMRRVMWRIMPLLASMMALSVIDRSNVGFAKLQMASSLGVSETAFGLASSLLFIGYSIFEIPSALAAHRFGARIWFSRIVFTWGLLTVLLAFVSTGTLFATVRFLIGAAEAGGYPGIIFYLTLWFPRRYRVQAVALLTIGSPLGNMVGSTFGGALLDLDGFLGFAGWQWVYLVTGTPAVILFGLILRYLPDGPECADFLTDAEKLRIIDRRAQADKPTNNAAASLRVLLDLRVWGFSLVFSAISLSIYGIIYWLPTIVRSFGATPTQNGLLTSVPWAIAAIALFWLPRHLKEHRVVLISMAVISLCGMTAFYSSTWFSDDRMRYLMLVLGTPCISLLFPCFWYLPSQMFRNGSGAAAIAAISTIGNLGGFAAQNLMPWMASWSGNPLASMLVPAFCLAIVSASAWIMLAVRRQPGNYGQPDPSADVDRSAAMKRAI